MFKTSKQIKVVKQTRLSSEHVSTKYYISTISKHLIYTLVIGT